MTYVALDDYFLSSYQDTGWFWCKWRSNLKSLIRQQDNLLVKTNQNPYNSRKLRVCLGTIYLTEINFFLLKVL